MFYVASAGLKLGVYLSVDKLKLLSLLPLFAKGWDHYQSACHRAWFKHVYLFMSVPTFKDLPESIMHY